MRRYLIGMAAFVLAEAPLSSADPPAAKERGPGPLLGCWRLDGEKPVHLAFEGDRVRMLASDHLVHYFARYEKDHVVLWSWGNKDVWKTVVKGDMLALDFGAGSATYHRVATEPDGLKVRPLALGAVTELTAARVVALREDLRHRGVEDQAVRKDPRRSTEMQKVDEDNTAFLKRLVGEIGWIDTTRFGKEAANAAFLIVQHSGDMALMAATLAEIEKGVRAKVLDPHDFALLHDRLSLDLGHKQRYGTQLGQGADEKLVVMPIDDHANVEKVRAGLGLVPLSQYLDYFKERNGGKVPEILEWE